MSEKMRVTRGDLDGIERRLAGASPVEILAWVHASFGPRAAILTSMQLSGTVLCHLADRAGLALDVAFVDTGLLHAETLATRDRLAATHPHLRVVTLSPARSFADQTRDEGVLYLSPEGQERCCELRKSDPLRAARGRWDVLVGALRRDEGGKRAGVRVVDLDVEMNALRVHPFAATTHEEILRIAREAPGVVVNPLHAMGFPTIGCFPCTTPVRPDEPERAGRWRHLAGVAYCGINPTDRAGGPEPSIELDARYAAALAG